MIAAPLTSLLKKNDFLWIDKALQAYNQFKEVMISSLVLHLSYFTKGFIVECDVLGYGLGAGLM